MVVKYFDFDFSKKAWFSLFIILLIPALLRHLSYFMAFTQTGIYPSVSPESVAFFNAGNIILFVLEEIILSGIIAVLYFFRYELHFLVFGYLFDPVIDVFNSLFLEIFNYIPLTNFIIRELALPYLLAGFLLMFYFDDYSKVKNWVYSLLFIMIGFQFIV